MAESTPPTQTNPTDVGADSNRISWAFLAQYYSFLNKDPSRLHCFYTKRSTLIHSTEGEETTACYGQQVRSTLQELVQYTKFKLTELFLGLLIKQEIHHKLMSLKFEDCKVYISNVDSQSSAEGGIIVQVIGEQSNHGGPWRKFSQTFFLAEQPNGYFVLNDICRYIKEEGDDDEINAGHTHPASIVTAAAVPNAHLAGSSLAPAQSTETTAVSDDAAAIAEATPLFADDTYSSIQETFPNLDASPAFNGTQEPESTTKADAVKEISSPAAAAPTSLPNGHHAPQATISTPAEPAVAETEAEPVVEAKHEEPEASTSASTTGELTPATAPAPAVTEEIPSMIAQTATPELYPAAAAAPAAPATSTPAPAPAPSSSPASTPAPAGEQAPAAPAPPAAPAAPKSWASLAAANGGANKWGKTAVASAKGISAAPTPAPSTSTQRPSTASTSHEAGSAAGHEGGKTRGKGASGSSSNAGHGSSASESTTGVGGNFHDSVLTVTTTMCYIKGVQENVSEKALKDVLTSRFGPMCECSIIRNKACAFVEYESLLSARKALQASVLRSEGGEGGVRVPVDPSHPASNGKDFAIIQILERKEHGERPPSQPRRGPGGGRTVGQGQGQGQPGQGQGQQGGNKRTGGGGRTGAQGAQQGNQQGSNNNRGPKPTAATK